MKKLFSAMCLCFSIVFCVLFIVEFELCKKAVLHGIMICAEVIIPSLFPFTVFLVFILGTGVVTKIPFIKTIAKPFFLNSNEFCVFLLSLFCGYPTGAKLLSELYNNGGTSKQRGRLLVCCCVNAGPSFIISAVGTGNFSSVKIGSVLFISHILSSFFLLITLRKNLKNDADYTSNTVEPQALADNFVNATAQGSSAIMNICFYVILFSVITAYFDAFSQKLPILKSLSGLLEVTVGTANSRNIYYVSFLLGFSGICIWLQVLTAAKEIRPIISQFAKYRILHGAFSSINTFIIVKIFKIKVDVFSSTSDITPNSFYGTVGLGIATLILALFFIFSVEKKKYSGNIVEDLL